MLIRALGQHGAWLSSSNNSSGIQLAPAAWETRSAPMTVSQSREARMTTRSSRAQADARRTLTGSPSSRSAMLLKAWASVGARSKVLVFGTVE